MGAADRQRDRIAMGVIGSALLQARIWNSFLRLGSSDPAERATAMSVLEEAGAASLPSLRLGTLQTSNPIKQFGAAVLLHRLEQPEGMDLLTEALRWRLEETPALAGPLEDAFVQIGSPDAVTALLEVWQELPDWTARQLALETICRVWARLQDSRVLPSLAERAERIPEAFEVTMRAFGVNAIPFLEQMLRDKNPMRRTLAIRTLGGFRHARASLSWSRRCGMRTRSYAVKFRWQWRPSEVPGQPQMRFRRRSGKASAHMLPLQRLRDSSRTTSMPGRWRRTSAIPCFFS